MSEPTGIATRDPWKPLVRLGQIALGLGILDLLRFPVNLLLFDFADVFLSLYCGWALIRRHRSALLKTAIAGGVILGNAMVSLPLITGTLLHEMDRSSPQLSAIVISRLILYGLQLLFWPLASAAAMCDQRSRGIRDAYADHARDTVIGAFCVSFWISAVLQTLIKILMFRLV